MSLAGRALQCGVARLRTFFSTRPSSLVATEKAAPFSVIACGHAHKSHRPKSVSLKPLWNVFWREPVVVPVVEPLHDFHEAGRVLFDHGGPHNRHKFSAFAEASSHPPRARAPRFYVLSDALFA